MLDSTSLANKSCLRGGYNKYFRVHEIERALLEAVRTNPITQAVELWTYISDRKIHGLCDIISAYEMAMSDVVKCYGRGSSKLNIEVILIVTVQLTNYVRLFGGHINGGKRMVTTLDNDGIYIPGLRPMPEPPPY